MRLGQRHYDLVLLDLMLPGMSGREVIKHVPDETPVICLTALSDVEDKVEMLSMGAVDYITKPFDNRELIARIGAQIRRRAERDAHADILTYREISLNTETFSASACGQPLGLTRREFLILQLMMEHPNKVFSKANIYETVWGEAYIGDDSTVSVHISNLRNKLHQLGADDYIQTVWGIGFKLQ